jgi:uncharacterized protein (DUF1015 family)
MAKISPFKAIRPARHLVHLVATRPYYTYKENVLKAKLEDNPYTFLHIINPEFGEKEQTEPNSIERFALVSDAYQEFIDADILLQDEEPHIYLYRQTKDDHEYMGIVAGASVQEYKEDKIKKHEATLTSREEMFTRYLDVVGYNAEPVVLSYSDLEHRIEPLLYNKVKERPEYEYTTTDRIKHELWVFNAEETETVRLAFETVESCYICDGHHRSASSVGLRGLREKMGQGHFPNEDFFLAFFLNEKRLHILEFNRLVRHLNGLTPQDFIERLKEHFEVRPMMVPGKPSERHDITACIEGHWIRMRCKKELFETKDPVKVLDPEILTAYVLDPILGIKDLKTSDDIEFVPGNQDLEKVVEKIASGEFSAAFFLHPVEIEDIKKVADHNLTMPPKSTWVEPKLRSGLTIYNINE